MKLVINKSYISVFLVFNFYKYVLYSKRAVGLQHELPNYVSLSPLSFSYNYVQIDKIIAWYIYLQLPWHNVCVCFFEDLKNEPLQYIFNGCNNMNINLIMDLIILGLQNNDGDLFI